MKKKSGDLPLKGRRQGDVKVDRLEDDKRVRRKKARVKRRTKTEVRALGVKGVTIQTRR